MTRNAYNTRRAGALALVAALALGIGLAWLLKSRSGTTAGSEPAAVSRTIEPEGAAVPTGAREEIAPVEIASAPDAANGSGVLASTAETRLVVRVRFVPDDLPVAAARVRIEIDDEESWATTDEGGDARWTIPAGVSVRIATVASTPATTAAHPWRLVSWGASDEQVEIVHVTAGASLSGRVVDEHGAAVPHAQVEAWNRDNFPYDTPPDRSVVADAEGRFTLPHLGAGFVAAATAPGLCCHRGLRGNLQPGANADGLEIVVKPCASPHGVVVDESGSPVEGARIQVGGGSFSISADDVTPVAGVSKALWYGARTSSDAEGRFTLVGLGNGFTYEASISHPEFLSRSEPLAIDRETRIVLKRGPTVRGVVLGADGTPLEGAEIAVSTFARARTARSDARGRFEVVGVAPGETLLRARASEHAIEVIQPFEVSESTPPVTLRLEPERRIAGRVVDASGAPVARSRVKIEGDREVVVGAIHVGERTTWEWLFGMQKSTSDVDGRFVFENLYDGLFRVTASDPSDEQMTVAVEARSGAGDLELRLDLDAMAKVVLVGRVVDGLENTPVTSFVITAMKPNGQGSWIGRARPMESPDGRFRIAGVEPGHADVQVQAVGYSTWRTGDREFGLGEHELAVRMLPTRTLELRVVDGLGQSLSNSVELTFRAADGRPLMVELPGGVATSTLQAHAEPVVASGLPAQRIAVLAEHRGETFEFEFDLRRPLEGVQELVLSTAAPRRLRLLFLEGPPPKDLEGFEPEGWDDLLERALVVGPSRLPKGTVRVRFEGAEGQVLGGGTCAPAEDGYDSEWALAGQGQSGKDQLAELDVALPGSVARAVVTSEGFRDVAVDLRTRSREIPRVVWLERP